MKKKGTRHRKGPNVTMLDRLVKITTLNETNRVEQATFRDFCAEVRMPSAKTARAMTEARDIRRQFDLMEDMLR
jgi:hypothetical protein